MAAQTAGLLSASFFSVAPPPECLAAGGRIDQSSSLRNSKALRRPVSLRVDGGRIGRKLGDSSCRSLGVRVLAEGMGEIKVMEVKEVEGTDQHTVEEVSNYQNMPTLPIAAALAASTSESVDVNGTVCNLLDRGNKKQVCLFYSSETEDLARRIAAETDSIELKSIKWGTFADGFPNIFVPNAHGIRSQHVAFLASFSSPGVIFEQLSIIYALPRMFVASFTLVLPFFPTGTLERMEDEGDIATAFTLARILSNIPISRGGPTSLVIFDIHALQERFYFGDNVLPCFESGIPLLKHRLHQLPDANNVSIAFPDEGAWKRFYKQLQHFPMIICTKVREGDNRIVRLKEGDPKGRHVVIVDDLVQSGGTLIECQKLLESLGASKVSAYATHGVFPKRSWERFAHGPNVKFVPTSLCEKVHTLEATSV
ncbi:hypothetical protein AXG93_3457s1190 [Marchantia polymorpha subsp. ruderalis]|uniref:ribose-phosphate diphosphokinase n=1 Tax=Marchantia polymorpha subsp. ruderalis TaxID=1480154 RepID=A0A176W0Q9_MARPO|nr:hypothetical protein AXG93_3457s1190 [Marchantia polymorpha subsp. ruderalis]